MLAGTSLVMVAPCYLGDGEGLVGPVPVYHACLHAMHTLAALMHPLVVL